MKTSALDGYEPNVSCPYCLQGDVVSSQWHSNQELRIWQHCMHCGKVCEETWTLTKLKVAETEEEEQALDFLYRHPECVGGPDEEPKSPHNGAADSVGGLGVFAPDGIGGVKGGAGHWLRRLMSRWA